MGLEAIGRHWCCGHCTHYSTGSRSGNRVEEEDFEQVSISHSFATSNQYSWCCNSLSTGSTISGDPQSAGAGTSTSTMTDAPSTPTSTLTPSAVPLNFPIGAYSLVTVLDTVATGCTSNNATWTCAPYTDYYSDPQKALTIINWDITGSSGAYKISSGGLDATFDTTFQNENLELLDAGKDTEHYRFQIMRSKTVNATTSIGDEKGDFECDYDYTNINGYLYTKMQRTYPDETVAVSGAGDNVWPYGKSIASLTFVCSANKMISCPRRTKCSWR